MIKGSKKKDPNPMQRKRVIVAFGDILGFGSWTRRAVNTPEESHELIDQIYDEFENHAEVCGCHIKFLGDGIMSLREMDENKTRDDNLKMIINFVADAYVLASKVQKIITGYYPRPEGFRLRITMGYVWKRQIKSTKRHAPEYIGYIVNLAQRLLEVSPTTLCVCHESVMEVLKNKKLAFKTSPVKQPAIYPRGVDEEDLKGLHSIHMK